MFLRAIACVSQGVPAGAVLDTSELYENEQLVDRGFVHKVQHPTYGEIQLLGWAPRMSGSSVPITAAPLLGAHSEEVLAADLALSKEELEGLIERGVIRNTTRAKI